MMVKNTADTEVGEEEEPKTRRVYCRLPEATVVEFEDYWKKSGLTRANFYNMALVYGARVVARQLIPDLSIAETIDKLVDNPKFTAAIEEAVLKRLHQEE